MRVETIEDVLFPGLNLMVRRLMTADGNLVVDAAGCGPPGRCPQCKHPATRVHSRYWRQISALPVGGRGLVVRLRVRRFFCNRNQCQHRTFVEQVAGLTEPRRRSSPAARAVMRAVAVELGGRPGQRLCAKLRLHGRRTALLGQLVAPPVSARAPRILGIDEFVFRKGRTYGTILVDVESSRPIDVLPDRETSSVAAWLLAHPGAEIVCRDRLMPSPRRSSRRPLAPWKSPIAGTSSKTSRRPLRKRAADTVRACADLPPQTLDRCRLPLRLPS